MLELAEHEFELGVLMCALEIAPHLGEFLRRGVLKRIDRLLLVADREDGAWRGARARAGGEFGDQSSDDFPLLAAGILRFVDQEMIDAEIELVMNPGRIDAAEQRQRLVDEIVVVEQAAARLLVLIALQNLVGDGEERGGTIAADHGAQAIQQCANASLLHGETLDQAGVLDRLGND